MHTQQLSSRKIWYAIVVLAIVFIGLFIVSNKAHAQLAIECTATVSNPRLSSGGNAAVTFQVWKDTGADGLPMVGPFTWESLSGGSPAKNELGDRSQTFLFSSAGDKRTRVTHNETGTTNTCSVEVLEHRGTPTPTPTPTPSTSDPADPDPDPTDDPESSTVFGLEIPNPIAANNFGEFIELAAGALLKVGFPIVIIILLWIGFKLLWAAMKGDPSGVGQAFKSIGTVMIGFAIILIGAGFVTLVVSILNIGQ